jgi:hypothetical protein
MKHTIRRITFTVAVLLGTGFWTAHVPAGGMDTLIDVQQERHDNRVDARKQRREDWGEAREARRDCVGDGPGCRREVRQDRHEAGKDRLQERLD